MSGGRARIIAIAEEVESRARFCARDGGPVMAAVLFALAGDLREGGPTATLVADFDGEPRKALLSLRIACALHRAALDGRAPALARFFPSLGGAFDPPRDAQALAAAVRAAAAAEGALIADYLRGPPQTNDVGRSASLVGGFLAVAATTGLPLDLLEIGTSAGLNLCFDRFHYRLGEVSWGDPASPVTLAPDWRGPPPAVEAPLRVRRRLGADIAPIELRQPGTAQRLVSYVWPDQPQRIRRLEGAIQIAASLERQIDKMSADNWLDKILADTEAGVARVVFHSSMWVYLPGPVQAAVGATIRAAGARATSTAPLAWLSFEPGGAALDSPACEVKLTLWPGGETRVLGLGHTHGAWVRWGDAAG